ncbi:MAG: pyridoxal phosphate-dependent aminotransferase, partial [Calditrichaeota bacterium]
MPRFPNFASRVSQITGSVFEKYRAKMVAQGQNLVRLHIGDTYLAPKYPLPIEQSVFARHPDVNRYCNTFGVDALRDVLAEKLRQDNSLEVVRENILVTNGATNALSISMMALVEPDDEVVILTPAWPFFFGMVRIAGGRVVEAPFYTRLFQEPELNIRDYLSKFITPKTAVLYLNTPNNPSGKVLNRAQVQAVAEVAQANDLWVVSDEAYDGLTFDGLPHISIASLPGMSDRTLTVFTFSKSFMFAGLRLGYVVASDVAVRNLNKMMVHQLYSPSTLAQVMMVEPVKSRQSWLPPVRDHYQELRDLFLERFQVAFPKPEGTYFIFFRADDYLHGRDYWQLIEACLDSGVSVAPGDSFGRDFGHYVRLCFTGEPRE